MLGIRRTMTWISTSTISTTTCPARIELRNSRANRPIVAGITAALTTLACATPTPAPASGVRRDHGSASATRASFAVSAAQASPTVAVSPRALEPAQHDNAIMDYALFNAFPGLREALPREALAALPTPVDEAPRLASELGIERLFIKRDDLTSDVVGGGKVRKLELLLARAKADGHQGVVTFGGLASNHALATALFAEQLGLRATLLLLPQPGANRSRQALLREHQAGATLRYFPGAKAAQAEAKRLSSGGAPGPYVIAVGGSSRLGNVAFVSAAFELRDQVARGELTSPDHIYMAMGTMGSAVVLQIGLKAAGLPSRLVAVRASSPGTSSERRFEQMFERTASYLRSLEPSFPELHYAAGDVQFVGDQLGGGYAMATPAGKAASARFLELAGLELEPTYTSKAAAALIRDAPELSGETVLFWYSYDPKPLDVDGLDHHALPPAFHHLFAG